MRKFAVLLACGSALVLILTSCTTPTTMEKQAQATAVTPIVVTESKPVSFARVIFKVPPGKEIGAFYDGLARIKHSTHRWELGTFAGSEQFRYAASEELRNAGYKVLGAENLVFGDDKADKARYQLGGTVNDVSFNTYGLYAGNFSEAKITVEYQLMDVLAREVKWTATAEGYGKTSGISVAPLMTAFRDSIRHVLSQSEFVAALKPGDQAEPTATVRTSSEILKVALPKPMALSLPDNIETVMDGVILIKVGSGHGSGFLISKDGYALTAAHVVSGLQECLARMKSGLELPARVVRLDESQDIALIKVDGGGHKPIALSLATLPSVGNDLFAIGAPTAEALAFSVTKGVVSGHREINTRKFLQTDASLNAGNSGGPLLDKQGRAVAIVSWKVAAKMWRGLPSECRFRLWPTNWASSGSRVKRNK